MAGVTIVLGAGASDGVGGALARRFARGGHRVVIVGRTEEKVQGLAEDVRRAGGQAEGFRADVTSEADQDALFA